MKINDIIKTMMMLLVVLYHSCMFFTGTWFDKVSPVYEAQYIGGVAKYLNTFHVQTFTMASGFLFYALRKEKGKYCNSIYRDSLIRAKRLLIPYLFTIIFWVLPFYAFFYGVNWNTVFEKYVLGCAPSQLWFLPMLFWLYIVFYIVFSKKKATEIGLASCIFISIVVSWAANRVGCKNIFQLITAVNYAMYYYLGAYLYENRIKMNIWKTVSCGIISVGCYVVSNYYLIDTGIKIKLLVLFSENVGYFAGVLFVYGIANVVGKKLGHGRIANTLKSNSFGIYLFHQQLIYPCILCLNGRVHPIIQVILSFCTVLFVSSLMVNVLKKWKVTKIMFSL